MKELEAFKQWLVREEKSPLTVEKYLRDVGQFLGWLGKRPLDKTAVLEFKEELVGKYAIASVNSMLSSLNCWLSWQKQGEFRVKTLKIQRQAFCSEEKELTKGEYQRLLRASQRDKRLCLLLQALCATGIRVSEHRYLTVEALKQGCATVRSKGKPARSLFRKSSAKPCLPTQRIVKFKQGLYLSEEAASPWTEAGYGP